MTHSGTPESNLDPNQLAMLDSLLAIGRDYSTSLAAAHDTAISEIATLQQAVLARDGVKVDTIDDYYPVLAGLRIQTLTTCTIVQTLPELSVARAAELQEVWFSSILLDGEVDDIEALLNPSDLAMSQECSAAMRVNLVERMHLDVSDPSVNRQIAGGLAVGAECMHELVASEVPIEAAALLTLIAFNKLAPAYKIA
jgi:hypothetical protein